MDIVTFPCEYLVFSSGYDERLIDPDKVNDLTEFCAEHGVIPLFIYDFNYKTRAVNIRTFPINNGVIDLRIIPNQMEMAVNRSIAETLSRNNIADDGAIVFQVGNFENASNVFLNMGNLDYCNISHIMNIKFLRNQQGRINIVYVDVDAESG
jgi:hypothetical protein